MAIKSLITRFGKGAATKQMYIYETWLRWIVRGIQFVLAVVVCGLYGRRVDHDHRHGNGQSAAWVYAYSSPVFRASPVFCTLSPTHSAAYSRTASSPGTSSSSSCGLPSSASLPLSSSSVRKTSTRAPASHS